MPAEYKSETTGMKIKDHRSDFLSSPEADQEREKMLNTALNADGAKKLFHKGVEAKERAEELMPADVFNREYQELLKYYFNHFLMIIAQYQAGKQRYHPQLGWKRIFEGEKSATGEKMQYFFEQPCGDMYYRGFIKRHALQPVPLNVAQCRDRIKNLPIKTDSSQEKSQFALISSDQLDQMIYFADSRFQADLLDLFRWHGVGNHDASGKLVSYDHPLLHHDALFQFDQPPFIIPIKQLQYGKPEVIMPNQANMLAEHIKTAEALFSNKQQIMQ